MNEQHLRKFFKFSEEDLLANQRGEFSPAQKKKLAENAKREKKSSRESAVILFIIALAGFGLGLGLGSIAPQGIGRYGILALLAVLWPMAWGGRGVRTLLDARALSEPVLRSVSGRIHLVHHSNEDFILRVDGIEFDLDEKPFSVIADGDDLTIFYLHGKEEILSVRYSTN